MLRAEVSGATHGKTVAVVLVVKDEANDILPWLAWYRLLGFDAAIVYDDDSTDGTWEVLREAARHWDIRLSRTLGEREVRYQKRQWDSYRHALTAYKDEFDWLAFFDADEFLQLRQCKSVTAFLARFPDADEVVVNWCNYGSSGHVLKPQTPPPLAYTWHGGAGRGVNRHVKSFVRPGKVGPNWLGVHCFDVAPERAVLANGAPVAWSETPGIIAGTPDWSVAKVMHYQCRSMEHFVERLKKRPQFQGVPNLWAAYDMRDEEDASPQALAGALIAGIEALRGVQPVAAPVEENGLIFDIGMAEGDDTALYLAKGFRVVGLEPSAKTYYGLCERFAAEIKAGKLTVLNYAAGRETGQILEFFHNDKHPRLSGFSAERPEFASGFTSYHVVTIGWAELVAEYGVPHYAKIDIEGAEVPFLAGAEGAALPAYISVECHDLGPAEALYKLGYRRFQLSDQQPPGGYAWPDPPREGQRAEGVDVNHTSGPFGRELPPDWLDFEAFCAAWRAARAQGRPTWYDCHAALA